MRCQTTPRVVIIVLILCMSTPAKHKRDHSSSLDSSAPVQQSVRKPGNEERGLRSSYTAQPQQKWKEKKYGWVPNAKRNITLFGNELLPRFYDSFRERAGSDPSVIRKMFIAERDTQYSVVQDVRKCEASHQYLVTVTIQLVLGSFRVRNTTPYRMTTATFQDVRLKQTN